MYQNIEQRGTYANLHSDNVHEFMRNVNVL